MKLFPFRKHLRFFSQSRSDLMTVAVDFSPRIAAGMCPRRGATVEEAPRVPLALIRRSATRLPSRSHRGLKSTATFNASLRDAKQADES